MLYYVKGEDFQLESIKFLFCVFLNFCFSIVELDNILTQLKDY